MTVERDQQLVRQFHLGGAYHDLQIKLMNPPITDAPEELCDKCGVNALGDTAVRVKDHGYLAYWCEDCATPVERCDQCGWVRCNCP